MKKFFPMLVLAATFLPACALGNQLQVGHPTKDVANVGSPQDVINKTAALVRWIGIVGTNEDDGSPIYDEVDPAKDPEARLQPYCAATWVSSDVMLTAAHCVEDLGRPPPTLEEIMGFLFGGVPFPTWDPTGQPVTYSTQNDIRTKDKVSYRGVSDSVVLSFDKKHDLALLKVTPATGIAVPSHGVATIAKGVSVGEDIQIVGHPAGMWWTYIKGVIAQVRPMMPDADNDPVDTLQVSAPVYYGNSGGGAFNMQGELVGVSSWMRIGPPNMAFYIDVNVAKPMFTAVDVHVTQSQR